MSIVLSIGFERINLLCPVLSFKASGGFQLCFQLWFHQRNGPRKWIPLADYFSIGVFNGNGGEMSMFFSGFQALTQLRGRDFKGSPPAVEAEAREQGSREKK